MYKNNIGYLHETDGIHYVREHDFPMFFMKEMCQGQL